MGKYLFQYVVPALILLGLAYKALYYWYVTRFKEVIDHTKTLKRKSDEYDEYSDSVE